MQRVAQVGLVFPILVNGFQPSHVESLGLRDTVCTQRPVRKVADTSCKSLIQGQPSSYSSLTSQVGSSFLVPITFIGFGFALIARRKWQHAPARGRTTEAAAVVLRAKPKDKAYESKTGLMNDKDKVRMSQIENLVLDDEEFPDLLDIPIQAPESAAVEMSNGLEFEFVPPPSTRYSDVRKDLPSVPFLSEPGYRAFAGNTAGDLGFDPAGLCLDLKKFVYYREAEIKHGRLAMIAAIAWPLVEIEEPIISQRYRLPDVLAESGGKFLPVFSGGLEDKFLEALLELMIFVGASFELVRENGKAPGDMGADPFKLANWKPPSFVQNLLPEGRRWMPEGEIVHGRLAMMVLVYDLIEETQSDDNLEEGRELLFARFEKALFSWEYWAGIIPSNGEMAEVVDLVAPDVTLFADYARPLDGL